MQDVIGKALAKQTVLLAPLDITLKDCNLCRARIIATKLPIKKPYLLRRAQNVARAQISMSENHRMRDGVERIMVGTPSLHCDSLHSRIVDALACEVPVDQGNSYDLGVEDAVG
ncbi:hypothetical protein LTR22_028070 [Elasticomyces elasticus]|nr:hypothetical protein LTR22_028070 [Elasticomyces elasticus]